MHDFVDKAVSKRARSLLLQSQEILYYKSCGQYINEHVHLNEVGLPEFDCMLIGPGNDGHIRSLYPGLSDIMSNEEWVLWVDKKEPSPITLSLSVMNANAAKYIRVVMTGGSKQDTVTKGVMRLQEKEDFLVCEIQVSGEVWMIVESCAGGPNEYLEDGE